MPGLAESSELFQWIESSDAALFFRRSTWLYPAMEIIHIIGVVFLVGSAFLFDLRLLGIARKFPVMECVRYLISCARIGFIVVLPSGLILFMADASNLADNSVFRVKLVLIVLAVLNAAIFHFITLKSVEEWNVHQLPPVAARLAGLLSILFWFSVIACGRLIAYF